MLLKVLNLQEMEDLVLRLLCNGSALGFDTCPKRCPVQYRWFRNREQHQQQADTSMIRISNLPTPIQLWLPCLPRTVGHFLFTFHIIMIKQLSDILSKFIYGPISIIFFSSLAFFSSKVKMNLFSIRRGLL